MAPAKGQGMAPGPVPQSQVNSNQPQSGQPLHAQPLSSGGQYNDYNMMNRSYTQPINSYNSYIPSHSTNNMNMHNQNSYNMKMMPQNEYMNTYISNPSQTVTSSQTSARVPSTHQTTSQYHSDASYMPHNNMIPGNRMNNIYPQQQPQHPSMIYNNPPPNQASTVTSVPNNPVQNRNPVAKPWHGSEPVNLREQIRDEIVVLLKSRRPNANDNWTEKLPNMARRLEENLYYNAETLEIYSDRSTLKFRLQQLAILMNTKNQKPQPAPQNPGVRPNVMPPTTQQPPQNYSHYSQNTQQPPSQQQGNMNTYPTHNNYMSYQPNQQVSGTQPSTYPQSYNHDYNQYSTQQMYSSTANSASSANPPNNATGPNSTHMNNSYMDSNINSHYPMNHQNVMMPNSMMKNNNPPHSIPPNPPIQNTIPSSNNNVSHPAANSQVSSTQGQQTNSQEENRRQVLKQQQQRLLLLRHASKCPHEPNSCTVTPHCASMKSLWKHIMGCKNQECSVPHCVSSRYVLSHYSKCKDQNCPVCGPVKEAIKRNYERGKEVVNVVSNNGLINNIPQNPNQPIPQNMVNANMAKPIPPQSAPIPPQVPQQPPISAANSAPVPTVKSEPPTKRKKKNTQNLNTNATTTPSLVPPDIKQETQLATSKAPLSTNQPLASGSTTVPPIQVPIPPPVVAQPPKKKDIYPLDAISSAVYNFTNEQIDAHFKTIHEGLRITAQSVKELSRPILDEILKMPHAQSVFGAPVDPVALGLNDYFDIVKAPMDLGTISKKLDSGSYRDFSHFAHDVHLTFDNAMLYNPKSSDVHQLAKSLKKEFDIRFKAKTQEFEKKIEDNRNSEDQCLICGEANLKFEPPVYYCNGPCASKIKRNGTYYCNDSKTAHWCSNCFQNLKEDVIKLPDGDVTKAELLRNKAKHTDESEEGWVECEGKCKRWVHQVCALFNNRRNVGDDVAFVCPCCVREKRKEVSNPAEIVMNTDKKMRAEDLPKTIMTDFLEKRIYKRLEIAYEEYAEKYGIPVEQVEKCPPIYLRQVSCLDKLQAVREGVYNRYKDKGYPSDFNCRTKCVVLFQNIDGQDVILFGMYVYEYGHKCPNPNQRRVYISYLDSVHYLRPKHYRTIVYHEILISYLDYVKKRGFHTAHIWACPPQKGDDYILYVHPSDQKTPKTQTLKVWYQEMLKKCIERGVVCELTDLYTEYLADPTNDATVLPYFEGDYWVNEGEVIVKNLESKKDSGANLDDALGNKKNRNKANRNKKNTTHGQEVCKIQRDPLMAKLASIIEPMKETFFVARLHPKEYAEKFKNEALTNKTEESKMDIDGQEVESSTNVPEIKEESSTVPPVKSEGVTTNDTSVSTTNESTETVESESSNSSTETTVADSNAAANSSNTTPADGTNSSTDTPKDSNSPTSVAESNIPPITKKPRLIMSGEDVPDLPDNTEDVDEVLECEHFDTRQSFLNLCQGNHYQFDQLRRAKHSSMMVLYHLHNPDAPKFVPTCQLCNTSILTGTRYRCEKCDIEFCAQCYTTNGASIHIHPLRANQQQLTEAQRKEKQKNIQLHLQLLQHASSCNGQSSNCTSGNCQKMRGFLQHDSICKIKIQGGCRVCHSVSSLLNVHARNCRVEGCKVPQCLKLREQIRKNNLRQLQMDDRRRKKMNSEYNRGSSAGSVDE